MVEVIGKVVKKMDKIWNIAEVVIAFCGCCVGYYFGEINGIFIALIIFAVIDFVTGICSAIINKELCSKISFRGIAKKLFMFLIVGMANVLDVYVLNSSHALRTAAIFFYLANEGISIIENIAKALEENIECLIKVKNKFHYLGYFEDERAIGTKIEFLKLQNTTLKKYMPNVENDKDNAN